MTHKTTRNLIAAGLPLVVLCLIFSRTRSLDAADPKPSQSTLEVKLVSEVEWTPLNPARGNNSPQAGTLWGDRAGPGETGFLVQFADGFSSPPHIHNVTYRGVVISGEIHNDDPEAEKMWMPKGSFWTQPAGEVHITSAKGGTNMAYIEIEKGPYLVWPPEKATDNGERPINVDSSNLVWQDRTSTKWITAHGAEIAFLWGTPKTGESNGTMLKLPAGFSGVIHTAETLKVVIVEGTLRVQLDGEAESQTLEPGSYLQSNGASPFSIQAEEEKQTILYLRSEGTFTVDSNQSGQ